MSQNPSPVRPPALPPLQPEAAAVLWDLHTAGVMHDFGSLPPAPAETQTNSVAAEAPAALVVVSAATDKPRAAAQPPAAVWTTLTPGTDSDNAPVVLLVAGHINGKMTLSSDAQALVQRMLAAVGLGARPLLWLNVQRGSGEQAVLHTELAKLAHTPKQPVLTLGKDMLSALMGRNVSPDQWDGMAPEGLPANACLGATYAPDYLLAQPIAKKKAWAHLLTWHARFSS